MEAEMIWLVEMRGSLGYGCETGVSKANANNEAEAMSIAAMMFPEMRIVSAKLLDAEVMVARPSRPV